MIKRVISIILALLLILSLGNIALLSVSAESLYAEDVLTVIGEGLATGDQADADTPTDDESATEATADFAEIVITDEAGADKDTVDGTVIGYVGDTDVNDKVNVRDATNIQKYMAKLLYFSEQVKALSNVDLSGAVNIKDATTIQKHLAGFTVESEVMHLMYETGTHVHNHIEILVEPGCEVGGFTSHSCICGDEYHTDETSAVGHNYTAVVTAPTCTEQGYTTHTCSRCRDTYKDNYFSEIGHKYNYKITTPTCLSDGYTTYTCSICGDSYKDDIVPSTGLHSYSNNKCTVCGQKASMSTAAFDELKSFIKTNGEYDRDLGQYVYGISPFSEYDSAALLYDENAKMILILYVLTGDGYVDVATLGIVRGENQCVYYISSQDVFDITGTFDMTKYTAETADIDYLELNLMSNVSNEYIADYTLDFIYVTLLSYVVTDEAYGLPVSIQELGFTSFTVE